VQPGLDGRGDITNVVQDYLPPEYDEQNSDYSALVGP